MTTGMSADKATRIHLLPTSRLGWWAVVFSGVAIVWTLVWAIVPFGALFAFAVGSVGGVLALIAVVRDKDKSLCVYVALVPMLFVLWFLLTEVLSDVGAPPAQ